MRIDYLTTASPWPADSGGRMRVGAIYDALCRRQLDVRLIVVGDEPDAAARLRIESTGGRVYPRRGCGLIGAACRYAAALGGGDPIAALFLDAGRIQRLAEAIAARQPHAVLLGDLYLAPLLPSLRRLTPFTRIIVDNHNVESLRQRRLAACAPALRVRLPAAIAARSTARLERRHLGRASQVWACSEHDALQLGHARLGKVHVIPNVVDTEAFAPAPEAGAAAVLFTGSFWYPPNDTAARRLIALSARLRARGLCHTLYLVGQAPTPAMRRSLRHHPGVVITGAVPDVRPYLARATVFAAPLEAGSGTKLKLLQAMAAGKAVLTTPVGAEGLGLTSGVDALVAEGPDDFEQQLSRLLVDGAERDRLGAAARVRALRHFSLPALDRALAAALSELPAAGAGS